MNKRIRKKKLKNFLNNVELGNLFFGNSRGKYYIENRNLVYCKEWNDLLSKCNLDYYGCPMQSEKPDFYGYDNSIFTIRPYYWGDDYNKAKLHNFVYKPTNFTIDWYKYPFRDSYMNKNLSNKKIRDIFSKCIKSL